ATELDEALTGHIREALDREVWGLVGPQSLEVALQAQGPCAGASSPAPIVLDRFEVGHQAAVGLVAATREADQVAEIVAEDADLLVVDADPTFLFNESELDVEAPLGDESTEHAEAIEHRVGRLQLELSECGPLDDLTSVVATLGVEHVVLVEVRRGDQAHRAAPLGERLDAAGVERQARAREVANGTAVAARHGEGGDEEVRDHIFLVAAVPVAEGEGAQPERSRCHSRSRISSTSARCV